MIHPDDLLGADICFLLTVDWMGKQYRFSTYPVDVVDTLESTTHRYEGGLSDISIDQSTNLVGTNVDGSSIAIELVFAGIDWVVEWLAGRVLDNSQCELSMITTKGGVSKYTEQTKIFLFRGKVVQPIIGSPDKPKGHVAFSIENGLNTSRVRLLDQSFEIDVYKFPGLDQRAAAWGATINYPIGQFAPFIFGKPDNFPQKSGVGGSIEFIDKAHVSPAYTIYFDSTATPQIARYIISMGRVAIGNVRIWDKTGGNFRNPVQYATNGNGDIYTYVQYQSGAVLEDNGFVPALDDDQTFWVSWGESNGGLVGLNGDTLEGGADICLYWLDKMGIEYNHNAWVGLSAVLNRYRFSGYVNDPEILAWDWLRDNIISLLPIEVVNGAYGLEPKLNLYFYTDQINPQYHISTSGMFELVTGLQPLDVDITNKVIAKFCYEGEFDHYLASLSIDPTLLEEDGLNTRDIISSHSYDQYGEQVETLELPFVWDLATAYRIARDKIRLRGMGAYGVEINAHPQYGYLQVGDIISLSSDTFPLYSHKCQIISKSWTGIHWAFVVHLESNTLINPQRI